MSEFQTINQVPDSLDDHLNLMIDTLVKMPEYRVETSQKTISVQRVKADTDSLQISEYHWDTLRITIPQPPVQTGFEGLPIKNSMHTSPLIFVGFLLLMFLPILVFYKSKTFIKDSFSMIFKGEHHQSTFRSFHRFDSVTLILMSVFFIISLSLYIYNYSFFGKIGFSYLKLGWILGITFAFVLIKLLINSFLSYIFFNKSTVRIITANYLNILSISGLFIFPILIFRIYSVPQLYFYLDILIAVILIISVLFIILKLFKLFFLKLIDLFYILLYLCTLEILPLFILFRVYQLIV